MTEASSIPQLEELRVSETLYVGVVSVLTAEGQPSLRDLGV